jgi:alpha-amylase/alpha-mannosidase (GH57 family)
MNKLPPQPRRKNQLAKKQNNMEKYICVHGHFYQPPRENPWLEAVELQDSAFPEHDWNERITYQCYAPNARARLLDGDGRIEKIVSNYSRMSFNFGPTVLSWMKDKQPEIYQAIVEADKKSCERFSGHGSAIAQVYNHMILPLANARDKHTQVIWGIRDFESRFGHKPEGMWLAETAADNETLDVLAEHGIKFTILSPFQAARVRSLEENSEWQDANGAHVDPSQPYLVKLNSGRSIAVFFYDAPIAQAVAFEKLLTDGEKFAARLLGAFDDGRGHDQVVQIATDGESYGHHFQYGDMALAYALNQIEKSDFAKLTVYAEFLEKHPPTHEAEIHQGSAWSCSHGVERWKSDCGCNSGGHGDWNQQWRAPLRNAMDWLRDQLAPLYETKAKEFLKNPWLARDDYIAIILDRSPENNSKFFAQHATRDLNEVEQITALRLLEMQRHAMLMFTSCGWFFDEISGLETVQVIQYAARALQLAHELSSENFEPRFLEILEQAKSNIPENQNGRVVYGKFVKPAVMNREKVAAHYAISSLFESYSEDARIYSFTVHQEDRQLFTAGNARLAIGRIKVTFAVTKASDVLTYGVLYMGEHNLNCGVRYDGDLPAYAKAVEEMRAAFERADFPELIRVMDKHFGQANYSLKNLFRDEQSKVLNQILATTRDEIHNTYRLLTDRYAPLTRFLNDIHAPPLNSLAPATEFVLNADLRKQFENGHLDAERVKSLITEARATNVPLETDALAFAAKNHFDRLSDELSKKSEDSDLLQRFTNSAALLQLLPFGVNLWKPQNTYDQLHAKVLPEMKNRGDEKSKAWTEKFLTLGEQLGFHVQRD